MRLLHRDIHAENPDPSIDIPEIVQDLQRFYILNEKLQHLFDVHFSTFFMHYDTFQSF